MKKKKEYSFPPLVTFPADEYHPHYCDMANDYHAREMNLAGDLLLLASNKAKNFLICNRETRKFLSYLLILASGIHWVATQGKNFAYPKKLNIKKRKWYLSKDCENVAVYDTLWDCKYHVDASFLPPQ